MRTLVIGIKGTVLALDPATGVELWRTELIGSGFVNVTLGGSQVLATSRGEIFCLERSTGRLLWRNPLRGLGQGLISIATEAGSTTMAVQAEQIQQEQAAASSAAAVSAATVAAVAGGAASMG